MVVTSDDVSNPTHLGSGGGRGPPFTSSFEMEALALSLAVDYVSNTEVSGPVLICTDSLSGWVYASRRLPDRHQTAMSSRKRRTTWKRLGQPTCKVVPKRNRGIEQSASQPQRLLSVVESWILRHPMTRRSKFTCAAVGQACSRVIWRCF